MGQPFLLRMPVHPWVRKYLLHHYPEPLSVSERGYASTLLRQMLEKPQKVDPRKIIHRPKLNLGSHYGIFVGAVSADKYGVHLVNEKIISFNDSMDDLLREEMYRFVQMMVKKGHQVDNSIKEFLAIYDICEDELPFENLKRWYYRERIRIDARRFKVITQPELILNFCA